jgi:hypothetical protein
MVHKLNKRRQFRKHTWSSRHRRGRSHAHRRFPDPVGTHLESTSRGTASSAQAHRQTLASGGSIVVATIVVGVEELLEPLQELKVVLEAALNQP